MIEKRHPLLAFGLGLLLALAACSEVDGPPTDAGQPADATPAAAPTGTVAETPAAAPAPAASSTEGGAERSSPEERFARGGLERLDTNLSKLELEEQESAKEAGRPRFEISTGDGNVVQNQAPAAAPTGGPAGGIGLAEGVDSTHHFGEVVQGIVADHSFRLVSNGDGPLVITRVKPSCGCTVAQIALVGADGELTKYREGTPIPVGTEFEVQAGLSTEGREGKMKSQVAIYSNDPASLFNLHLQADVQSVLDLEPRTLHLGNITSAETATGTLSVKSSLLDPFLLSIDEQFTVDVLSLEIEAVDPDENGRSREWNVTATLGPNIPEGMRNYPVRLITDQRVPNPKNPEDNERTYQVVAYVQAQVTGLVSASPAFVSFGMLRPGQVVERQVRIESHDGFALSADATTGIAGLVKGQNFQYSDQFSVELRPVEGAETALDLVVRCEGMPEDANGSFGGMVDVNIGHPLKDVVQVRFSGVCRQGLPAPRRAGGTEAPASGGDGHEGHDHGH